MQVGSDMYGVDVMPCDSGLPLPFFSPASQSPFSLNFTASCMSTCGTL